jgi:hypothetical protein
MTVVRSVTGGTRLTVCVDRATTGFGGRGHGLDIGHVGPPSLDTCQLARPATSRARAMAGLRSRGAVRRGLHGYGSWTLGLVRGGPSPPVSILSLGSWRTRCTRDYTREQQLLPSLLPCFLRWHPSPAASSLDRTVGRLSIASKLVYGAMESWRTRRRDNNGG